MEVVFIGQGQQSVDAAPNNGVDPVHRRAVAVMRQRMRVQSADAVAA